MDGYILDSWLLMFEFWCYCFMGLSRDLNGMFKVLKDYDPMTPIDDPHMWHDTELGQSDTFGSSVMMGSQHN